MDGFWKALGPILERFWGQVGGQVGAKLAPKSEKLELQDDVKKHQKKEATKSGRGGLRVESSRGPGPPVSLWLKPKAAFG